MSHQNLLYTISFHCFNLFQFFPIMGQKKFNWKSLVFNILKAHLIIMIWLLNHSNINYINLFSGQRIKFEDVSNDDEYQWKAVIGEELLTINES